MATFDFPKSKSRFGDDGDIFQDSGQFGRSAFADSVSTALMQHSVDFRNEFNYRYYLAPSTGIDFTLGRITAPVERGYTNFIRNTGSSTLTIKEGAGATTLTTVGAGNWSMFIARASGATDTWEYLVGISSIFANFVFVDSVWGDNGTGAVHRPDLQFRSMTSADTAAAALTNPVFYVRPGSYSGTVTKAGATWYFAPGAVVTSAVFPSDANILGRGSITMSYAGAGGSDVYLEAFDLNGTITITGSSGSGTFIRAYDFGGTLTFASTMTGSATAYIYSAETGDFHLDGGNVNLQVYRCDSTTVVQTTGTALDATVYVELVEKSINSSGPTFDLGHSTPSVVSIYGRHIYGYVGTNYAPLPAFDAYSTGTTSIFVDNLEGTALRTDSTHTVYFHATNIYKAFNSLPGADPNIFFIRGSGNVYVSWGNMFGDNTNGWNVLNVTSTGSLVVYGETAAIDETFLIQTGACNTVVMIDNSTTEGAVVTPFLSVTAGTVYFKTNKVSISGRLLEISSGSPTITLDINSIIVSGVATQLLQTFAATDATVYIHFNNMELTNTSGTSRPIWMGPGTYYFTGNRLDSSGITNALFELGTSPDLYADIKRVHCADAPVINTTALAANLATPVSIEYYTDETSCAGDNTVVNIVDRAASGGSYPSLTFGGRFVAAGASLPTPFTVAHNAAMNIRLVRASLICSSGTPTASLDYTAGATLTVQNHGQIVGQVGYVASGAGAITTIGSATVTNTSYT